MKRKNNPNRPKLTLNKTTISNLTKPEQISIVGGGERPTVQRPTSGADCTMLPTKAQMFGA